MQLLKQSTATTLIVGPVLDSTGAAVTTAVVGDFKIAKNGTTATLSGATVTHDANGYYTIALTTTNTDTTGRLTIYSGNTAQSMATHRYSVLLASVYDALITNATTAAGGLGDVQRLAGQAITAASGVTFPSSVASPTNITSASGVTLAATTHTGAVIPTVTSVTNAVTLPSSASINITGNITGNVSGSVGSVTGNVGGNVVGSVASVTAGVTVSTNNDKTGYSLTQAFPSNFSSLAIAAGTGAVNVNADAFGNTFIVTNLASQSSVDTLTGYVDTEVAAIKAKTDLIPADIGSVLISTNVNQRTVMVTGSNHVAADVHGLQSAVITAAKFAAGAIDANALAASAAAEVASAVQALQVLQDLILMITGSGVSPKWSANALSLAPTGGGGGGTGTGARTVTITAQLSGAPLEGAWVRLTKGAETYIGQTNVSGQLTFNVDDGTWVVSITSPGATFGGASLVVDGPETMTYSLTAISILPSLPGSVTGYWLCLGANGLIESGATISMQAVEVPVDSIGLALDTTIRTATSNGSGVAQFTDLIPGARYAAWRGSGSKRYVTIPEDASGVLELNSILGSP